MRYLLRILLVLILVPYGGASFAQEQREAKIIDLEGEVQVRFHDAKDWVRAEKEMILGQGDEVKVADDSWALVNVDGQAETALLELQENSQVLFSRLLQDKTESSQQTLLDLSIGKILIKAKKLHSEKSKFEIKTPTSVVGVRGTTFAVEVESLE